MPQDGHHKWKIAKPKTAPAFSVLRFDFACLELTGQMCEVEALQNLNMILIGQYTIGYNRISSLT